MKILKFGGKSLANGDGLNKVLAILSDKVLKGEEFAVVLPDTNEEGALQIAEAIRSQVQALAIPHEASLVSSQVTLSLGLASIIPSSDMTSALLLKAADEALYEAKKTGRDRCYAFIKLV
ncbi:MAG: diguanylate cyclase [Flavobacterium sp.]|nr:MAG: diguanylate cyclase [Flavobacterium sp.]